MSNEHDVGGAFVAGMVIGIIIFILLIVNIGPVSDWKEMKDECELSIPRNQICVAEFKPEIDK